MRDFGKVHASFWSSKTMRAVSDDGRTLGLYLLTSPHTTASGVFRLPDAYAMEDLQWVSERLRNGFETLSKVEFCERCPETSWVWICKWNLWNKPENPNVRKSIDRALLAVPESVSFRSRMLTALCLDSKGFRNGSETPSPSPLLSALDLQEQGEFEKLPCEDGSLFEVPADLAAEITKAYPKVDHAAEFAKMRIWLLASPANRKTRRGMSRFINSWLSRAPERAPANGQVVAPIRVRRELGA